MRIPPSVEDLVSFVGLRSVLLLTGGAHSSLKQPVTARGGVREFLAPSDGQVLADHRTFELLQILVMISVRFTFVFLLSLNLGQRPVSVDFPHSSLIPRSSWSTFSRQKIIFFAWGQDLLLFEF